jgi:hypothetical protein
MMLNSQLVFGYHQLTYYKDVNAGRLGHEMEASNTNAKFMSHLCAGLIDAAVYLSA